MVHAGPGDMGGRRSPHVPWATCLWKILTLSNFTSKTAHRRHNSVQPAHPSTPNRKAAPAVEWRRCNLSASGTRLRPSCRWCLKHTMMDHFSGATCGRRRPSASSAAFKVLTWARLAKAWSSVKEKWLVLPTFCSITKEPQLNGTSYSGAESTRARHLVCSLWRAGNDASFVRQPHVGECHTSIASRDWRLSFTSLNKLRSETGPGLGVCAGRSEGCRRHRCLALLACAPDRRGPDEAAILLEDGAMQATRPSIGKVLEARGFGMATWAEDEKPPMRPVYRSVPANRLTDNL